jgi:hypothetical protein
MDGEWGVRIFVQEAGRQKIQRRVRRGRSAEYAAKGNGRIAHVMTFAILASWGAASSALPSVRGRGWINAGTACRDYEPDCGAGVVAVGSG